MKANLKLLLAGLALAALGAGSAVAADLPIKAPPPAPVVVNWTGFYIGGNLGGVGETGDGISNFLDTGAAAPLNFNPNNNTVGDFRFMGGLQAGYNYQFSSHWVAGVEVDFDWTNAGYNFCRQTSVFSGSCVDTGVGFETISTTTNWLATARGRVGYALDNWLFYGTGGGAWVNLDTTLSLSCVVAGCGSSTTLLAATRTVNNTLTGWVAGAGVEGMFWRNWTARLEWLHIDVGNINHALVTVGNTGTQTATWSRGETFDEVRLGVSYLFH